jgi:hypothetical protein
MKLGSRAFEVPGPCDGEHETFEALWLLCIIGFNIKLSALFPHTAFIRFKGFLQYTENIAPKTTE